MYTLGNGSKIKATMKDGRNVEGYLLLADLKEHTNTVVIVRPLAKPESYEVEILNVDAIVEHRVDHKDVLEFLPDVKTLSDLVEMEVETKLKKSVEKYRRYLRGFNENVGLEVQNLYWELAGQYECEWRDSTDIFLKEFELTIHPPYGPDSIEGGNSEKAKERVQHILSKFH